MKKLFVLVVFAFILLFAANEQGYLEPVWDAVFGPKTN